MTINDAIGPHTLDGWRRYLADQPTPPALPTVAEYAAMSPDEQLASSNARLDHHSAVTVIQTPLLERLLHETRLLLVSNRRQLGARQGAILSGPPTTGKTTALLALGSAVETLTRTREPSYDGVPVAYISLPPLATPKSISRAITAFYGIHPPARTTFPELSDAAVGLLNDLDTRLLIIDEIHNMAINSRVGAEASDFLKYLAERAHTTMIYAGVEVEHAGLFDGVRGRQLAGRFTLVEARPFSYASQPERQTWTRLVGAFESNLRLINHRAGTLPKLSRYVYTRSGGHIGSLASLIRKAAFTSILDSSERITRELLENVRIDFAAHNAEPSVSARLQSSA